MAFTQEGPLASRPWEITDLIERWDTGDRAALDEIFEKLFDKLLSETRKIFHRRASRRGHTLQPTALVNEAFMKIANANRSSIPNSAAFRAYYFQTVARLLAEHHRRKMTEKRGGLFIRVPLDVADHAAVECSEINAVQAFELLERLSTFSPDGSEAVAMRTYLGLTIAEISEVQGVSESTVKRNLKLVNAWLRAELADAT
jgi:RNA polymerase sigma factor (TIGR02999 family)